MTQDLVEQFAEINRAERGNVYLIDDIGALTPVFLEVARVTGATQAATATLSEDLKPVIEAACQEAGIALQQPPYAGAMLPAALAEAGLGISEAAFAIAATGTVAQVTTVEAERLTTVLCWAHFCIVRASTMIARAIDSPAILRRAFEAHPQNCSVTYITGPSRSADIEFKIQMGVHGPQQTHTVVLRNA